MATEILRPSAYTVDSQNCDNPTSAYDDDQGTPANTWSDSGLEAATRWHTFGTPTLSYSSLDLHIVSAGQATQEGVDYAYLEYTVNGGTSWEVVRGPGGWGNIYGGKLEDTIPLSPSQDMSLVQVRARSFWDIDGADVYVYEIWTEGVESTGGGGGGGEGGGEEGQPLVAGVRPYVKSVKLLPTEIKGSLTVSGRVSVELLDEPDGDVGVDPYVASRSYFPDVPGTFWKKWLARNRNFKGRLLKVYQGWLGQTEEEFELRWVGRTETATYDRGVLKIEAADLLKDLSKIEVPPKLDVKLAADMTADQTSLTVTDASGLDDPSGYLRVDDEVVGYASIDTGTGVITGASRGLYGTSPAEHSKNAKVQKVKVYPPANMFDRMNSMLTDDGGIASGYVDSAAFDDARDQIPGETVQVEAVIAEPTRLDKLYFELVELAGAKSWVGEHNQITIARDLPNHPERTLTPFSDADNILHESAKLDRNEKSRLTRVFLYWDKTPLGKDDEVASYGRLDVAIDADAESANEYGDVIEKKVYCRWLHSAGQVEEEVRQFAANAAMRMVWRNRNASPMVTVDAELKDEGIKTGDWLLLSTDEILDIYGFAISSVQFQAVKRDHRGNKVTLVLLRGGTDRIGYIAPDATPDWDSATDADKKYAFIADDDGLLPDGTRGYHIY